MAPKTKFTKEQIIDAAFEIARSDGIAAITIRGVAEKLGSSIAPIYVNFNEVAELVAEVYKKTHEVAGRILAEQNSGHPFLDIGVASIQFARLYPVLFRDIVMQKNDQAKHNEEQTQQFIELMKKDPKLGGLSDDVLRMVLLKMKIFQLGLSVMVANDMLPEVYTEEQMVRLMSDMVQDVIAAAKRTAEQS